MTFKSLLQIIKHLNCVKEPRTKQVKMCTFNETYKHCTDLRGISLPCSFHLISPNLLSISISQSLFSFSFLVSYSPSFSLGIYLPLSMPFSLFLHHSHSLFLSSSLYISLPILSLFICSYLLSLYLYLFFFFQLSDKCLTACITLYYCQRK